MFHFSYLFLRVSVFVGDILWVVAMVYLGPLENDYRCSFLFNTMKHSDILIANTKRGSAMAQDEPPRKVHTIGVRVDGDLLKLLQAEAERRGETVANYVRVSAKMRVTGQLVEPGRTRLNEF